jgi:ubiquinone/menaquinone biosynthesis C-methylase UbiE
MIETIMEVKNPFENKDEASRYQSYRPMYHHLPFQRIKEYFDTEISCALDVACGTGHSTFALSKIAQKVIGCDLSSSMLAEARKNYDLEFIQSPGEKLPFEEASFDLMNISMGFHWLEQEKFLNEAKRLLRPNGYLNIDSYGFSGLISKIDSEQEAHNALFDEYLPAASRREGYPTSELLKKTDLSLAKEILYEHEIEMSQDQFINLIKTWSNFQIKDIDNQKITSEKMEEVYSKIFRGGKLGLGFRGKSLLLR